MAGVLLWGWYDTGKEWVKVQVDEDGFVLVDMSKINLDDLADVNVTAPTDGYVLYWDETAGEFKLKAVSATKIIDADADTKVDVEETADEDIVRMDVAGVEAFKLSAVGIQTLAKQSGCFVYPTSNQNLDSAGYRVLRLNGEVYDVQNEFDNSVKSGAADATEAFKLHDADGGFVAGDVGKTVYNTIDNTYALVTAFVNDGELTLNTDIMADTETYELYFCRFTVKEAGTYFIRVQTFYEAHATGRRFNIVRKNGVSLLVSASFVNLSASYLGYSFATGIYVLAANDYLDVWPYQNSGVTLWVSGSAANTFVIFAKIA